MWMKENASIAWLMNIARGKRDMNKLTNEELDKYAEALKDFCAYEMEDCDDCPFHNYGGGCALGVPADWDI